MSRLLAVEFSVPLLAMATHGSRPNEYWRVQNPLPSDAEFLYCFMGEDQRSVVFVFAHPSFPDVEEQLIPRRTLTYEGRVFDEPLGAEVEP